MVAQLTGGLVGLAKQRKVQRRARRRRTFASPNVLTVEGGDGTTAVGFEHCIIAAGSSATQLPGLPYDDPRLIDSTGALELADVPERLLVIGGGIIGLEMATVYDALGSKVTVVELLDALIPGCDKDLVRPLQKRIEKRYEAIHLKTKVTAIEATDEGLRATFEGDKAPEPQVYDRMLLAVGRRPNGAALGRRQGGRGGGRARLHRGRPPDAHERAAHLRHRRHRRRADARPQGHARGQGGGRGDRRPRRRLRRADHPVGGLHRSRGRVDGAHRDGGQGAGHRLREGRVPVGGVRPRALDRARGRARPSCSSTPTRAASSAPASSA